MHVNEGIQMSTLGFSFYAKGFETSLTTPTDSWMANSTA